MPLSKEVLLKYVAEVFIETGTAEGNGIQLALDCGFKEVFSIELVKDIADKAIGRFKSNPNVHIYQGDSLDILPGMLATMPAYFKTATFWLDAHINGKGGQYGRMGCPAPVELPAAMDCPLNKTILIDDMRYFTGRGRRIWGHARFGSLVQPVYERKGFSIRFEDGITTNDIMVIYEDKADNLCK